MYNYDSIKYWIACKLKEEQGLGTIEIVVILGILLGIALLFRETVTKFVTELMAEFFNADKFK